MRIKPHLHRKANRMRTRHAKTMRMSDVDVFLRREKQHSAVWRTFGEQPNAIRRLLVHQRKFAYNTFMYGRMPNNLQIYPHERMHHFRMPHSCSDVNPHSTCGVCKAAYTLANILFVNGPCNALTSWECGKVQINIVPTEPWISFVFVKEPMEIVRNELFANPLFIGTNYTNIVFANGFLNTMKLEN